jgi:hypothetical protein
MFRSQAMQHCNPWYGTHVLAWHASVLECRKGQLSACGWHANVETT